MMLLPMNESGASNSKEGKMTYNELEKSGKMASLSRLVSAIAHEIRNPLTSIKMRIYSLKEELNKNASAQEDLRVIEEEIDRLDTIVKNFLNFTRPPRLRLELINIQEILNATIQLLKPKMESQGIIIKRLEEKLPPIEIDREQIKQVLINIMVNAIEVMPRGGEIDIIASEKCLRPLFSSESS